MRLLGYEVIRFDTIGYMIEQSFKPQNLTSVATLKPYNLLS